jgi:hypothetical protein
VGLLHVRLDAEVCKLCACLFVEGEAACACSDVSLHQTDYSCDFSIPCAKSPFNKFLCFSKKKVLNRSTNQFYIFWKRINFIFLSDKRLQSLIL